MKKLLLLTAIFLFGGCLSAAAQHVVSGTVTDKAGSPIPGARITVSNGTESTLTELDGTFRLETKSRPEKIMADYVGMQSRSVRATYGEMSIRLSKGGWFEPRYQGELNVGYGTGGKIKEDGEKFDAEFNRMFIETVHGVRFNKYLFAGIGVGFQYATDQDYWESFGMLPLFFDLKGYYPVTEDFAPYVKVDLGHAWAVTDNDGGAKGFYAAYGIGLNYRRLNFGIGWQHQSFAHGDVSVNSFYVNAGINFGASNTRGTRSDDRSSQGKGDKRYPRYQGEVNVGYGFGGKVKIEGEKFDAEYGREFVETIHGIRINKYAFAGLGAQLQYIDDPEVLMLPLFIDLKGYYPIGKRFAPYIFVDLGYSLGVSDGDGDLDGFFASYGLGINYGKLDFGLGWQHQTTYSYHEGGGYDASVNSFFLKVGVKF